MFAFVGFCLICWLFVDFLYRSVVCFPCRLMGAVNSVVIVIFYVVL